MGGFTGELKYPTLDVVSYKKKLHDHCVALLRELVTKWLAAVMPKIPEWKSASRATFQKLADSAGVVLPPAVLSNGLTRQPGAESWLGESQSEGKFSTESPVYYFLHSTDLFRLLWNEYHDANAESANSKPHGMRLTDPGPYNSQAEGMRAYVEFIKTIELPDIRPFVNNKTIKI